MSQVTCDAMPKKPEKAGSAGVTGKPGGTGKPLNILILCLVGGILILGIGIFTIFDGFYTSTFLKGVNATNAANITVNGVHVSRSAVTSFLSGAVEFEGFIGVAAGLIVIISGIMAYSAAQARPDRVKIFGAIAVVFSLISLLDSGGLVIGFVLALIGGILALLYKNNG